MDARLHHLQSEAEYVSPAELLAFLQEFYRETLDLFNGRQRIARSVAAYDANNAYQQVLGRQDVHLRWLSDAIEALGGQVGDGSAPASESDRDTRGDARKLVETDARAQAGFIDRWTPRVSTVTNARNRKMLELILGEMKEHLRLLQQAAEGRSDLLGRHSDGKVLRGQVIPVRPQN
jgi:hypothetical protein